MAAGQYHPGAKVCLVGRKSAMLCILILLFPAYISFQRLDSTPYMDEIFHVRQTQQYCNGNWLSWDPMITTLPGLYLSAYAYRAAAMPLYRIERGVTSLLAGVFIIEQGGQEPEEAPLLCGAKFLRSVNLIFAVGISFYTAKILRELHPTASECQVQPSSSISSSHDHCGLSEARAGADCHAVRNRGPLPGALLLLLPLLHGPRVHLLHARHVLPNLARSAMGCRCRRPGRNHLPAGLHVDSQHPPRST